MNQELNIIDAYFNGAKGLGLVNEGPQDVQEFKDYHMERNISFSLPFNFSKHGPKGRYEKKLEISTIDNNNVITRQVEITSEHGPLNGVDQDVLLCLMSIAKAQKTDTPSFTMVGICKILQISDSSTKKIKESIRKMTDVKLVFKDSFVSSEGRVQKEYITRLINNVEFQEAIKRNSLAKEQHYVRFDKKVIDNIMRDFTITIPREFYNKLPYGGPKRLLQLLEANWINTKKPIYTASLEDLASILGINSEIRFVKRKIIEYLEALKKNEVNFEYSFYGRNPIFLRVSYAGLGRETSLDKECGEIYEKYLTKFEKTYLEKYEIEKFLSFWSMKYHKEDDFIYVGKHKTPIKKIYMAIEQLLSQYEKGPVIKNFHALIDKTYDSILIIENASSLVVNPRDGQIRESKEINQEGSKSELHLTGLMIEEFITKNPARYEDLKMVAQSEYDELFEGFEGFSFETYLESKITAELMRNSQEIA